MVVQGREGWETKRRPIASLIPLHVGPCLVLLNNHSGPILVPNPS